MQKVFGQGSDFWAMTQFDKHNIMERIRRRGNAELTNHLADILKEGSDFEQPRVKKDIIEAVKFCSIFPHLQMQVLII